MEQSNDRYKGQFFTCYTNIRMKLYKHDVPIENDGDKISCVYGYSRGKVAEVFRQLDEELMLSVDFIKEKYGKNMDKELSKLNATFAFIGDQFVSEYLSFFNIMRKVFEPYTGIKMICAAANGDTSNQTIQTMYDLVISHRPMITSVLIGANDMHRNKDIYAKNVCSSEEYKENIEYIAKVLRHNKSKVIFNTLPPINNDEFEKAYATLNWTYDKDAQGEYNRIIRNVSEANGCILNDIAEKFKDFGGQIQLLNDGLNITSQAQCFIACKLIEIILETVQMESVYKR